MIEKNSEQKNTEEKSPESIPKENPGENTIEKPVEILKKVEEELNIIPKQKLETDNNTVKDNEIKEQIKIENKNETNIIKPDIINDPIIKKEDPVIKNEDPIMKNEDPIIKNEDPIIKNSEPAIKNENPIIKEVSNNKEEPIIKEEPKINETPNIREESKIELPKSISESHEKINDNPINNKNEIHPEPIISNEFPLKPEHLNQNIDLKQSESNILNPVTPLSENITPKINETPNKSEIVAPVHIKTASLTKEHVTKMIPNSRDSDDLKISDFRRGGSNLNTKSFVNSQSNGKSDFFALQNSYREIRRELEIKKRRLYSTNNELNFCIFTYFVIYFIRYDKRTIT